MAIDARQRLDLASLAELSLVRLESAAAQPRASEAGPVYMGDGDMLTLSGLDFCDGLNSAELAYRASGPGRLELHACLRGSGRSEYLGSMRFGASEPNDYQASLACRFRRLAGQAELSLIARMDEGEGWLQPLHLGFCYSPEVLDAFSRIKATHCVHYSGLKLGEMGAALLCYIEDGAYAVYPGLDFGQGANYFQARVSTPMSGGTIEVLALAEDGGGESLLGQCQVYMNGGWIDWVNVQCPIRETKGRHTIKLRFRSARDHFLFNLDSFVFAASQSELERDALARLYAAEADSLSPGPRPTDSGGLQGIGDRGGMVFSRLRFASGIDFFQARLKLSDSPARLELWVLDPRQGGSRKIGKVDIPRGQGQLATLTGPVQAPEGLHCLELILRCPRKSRDHGLEWLRFTRLKRGAAPRRSEKALGGRVPAVDYSSGIGFMTELSSEGGYAVAYTHDGSLLRYDRVRLASASGAMVARLAARREGSEIEVTIDGKVQGRMRSQYTGDWQNWDYAFLELPRELEAGDHEVWLRFQGDEGFLANILWFSLEADQVSQARAHSGPRCLIDGRLLGARQSETGLLVDARELGEALGLPQDQVGLEAQLDPRPFLAAADRLFFYAPRRALLEARLIARAKERPKAPLVEGGRLRGAGGQSIRAATLLLEGLDALPGFEALDALRANGLNALQVISQAPSLKALESEVLPAIDLICEYCARIGIYLILCPDAPDRRRYEPLGAREFWLRAAPRYADSPQVIMVTSRYLANAEAPYPSQRLDGEAELIGLLRSAAPHNHLAVLNYERLGQPGAVLADLRRLGLGPEDGISVAWVEARRRIAGLPPSLKGDMEELRAAGYSLLNVELPSEAPSGGSSFMPLLPRQDYLSDLSEAGGAFALLLDPRYANLAGLGAYSPWGIS